MGIEKVLAHRRKELGLQFPTQIRNSPLSVAELERYTNSSILSVLQVDFSWDKPVLYPLEKILCFKR